MTEIEDRLIESAKNGEWLRCEKSDPAVPAELIRTLLLGRKHQIDPRGVRISGARIEGALDLDMVTAVAGLNLYNCVIDEPIQARQVSLPYLVLFGGRCAGLDADGARVDSRLFLRGGLRIAADSERGAINLLSAHVAGDVELSDVHISNTTGPVLFADGARVDGALFLRRGSLITGDSENGAVRLRAAQIGGNLELIDMDISNPTGPALDTDGVRIGAAMLVRNGTRITGNSERGSLNLLGAHIKRNLDLNHVEITSTSTGPALFAERIQVDGTVFIRGGIRITGHGDHGAINLVSAQIGGGMQLGDVDISNITGPGLQADRIHVDGSLFFRNNIRITGHGERGAVNLMSAHITTDLDLEDAELTNTAGPSLRANRARIDGGLLLRKRIALSGNDADGAVVLNGAQVGGWLGTRRQVEMTVSAGSNPLLDLREMTVGTTMAWPPNVVCPAGGVGRTCEYKQKVQLDEFSYASLGPSWSWQKWLHVIRCHTPVYHASAYQRLAAVERAAGHDGNVRKILIAQQDDLRRDTPDAVGGWSARLFHRLWGFLAGYGYAARRTAVALLIVLAVAGSLGWVAGQVPTRSGHHAAERVVPATTPKTEAGVPCSTVELVGLGLDRGLPLGMIGMRTRCDLDTSSRRGAAFTWAIWFIQVLVWGLATLALAGYTNLVRKPG